MGIGAQAKAGMDMKVLEENGLVVDAAHIIATIFKWLETKIDFKSENE